MNRLSNLLSIKSENKTLRKNNNNKTFLSQKAIQKFLNEYEDTDYKALKLVEYNFITDDLLENTIIIKFNKLIIFILFI